MRSRGTTHTRLLFHVALVISRIQYSRRHTIIADATAADSEVNTSLEDSIAASVAVNANPGRGSVSARATGRLGSRDDEGSRNSLESTLRKQK